MPITTPNVNSASGSRLSNFLATQYSKLGFEVEDLQDALARSRKQPISSSLKAIKQCPRALGFIGTAVAAMVGSCVLAGQWELGNLHDLSNQVVSEADSNADKTATQAELFALVQAYDRKGQLPELKHTANKLAVQSVGVGKELSAAIASYEATTHLLPK